jgi:hypothetical protein
MRRVFLPFPPAPHATTVRLCGWFLDNLRLGVHAWCAQRDRQVEKKNSRKLQYREFVNIRN